MAYAPAPALSSSDVTDGAGGAVSRTIAAAGGIFDQAAENQERSSFADMMQDLRAALRGMTGKRGGGHRPIAALTPLTLTGVSATSTTLSAADALYSQSNENTYRGNIGGAINSLIQDANAIASTSGPRITVERLTDNSGGTPGSSIASAGATYNQAGENNTRATIVVKLNEIADAMGA